MIRRDVTAQDGSAAWLLLPQIEHARLAAKLADCWGAAPFMPLAPREVVLAVIARHDDGWREWEERPRLDPQEGRPLSFTEMSVEEMNRNWERSIHRVADLGPLAQYLVAGHFLGLRRRSDDAATTEGARFIERFDGPCRQWLTAWQREDPARNTPAAGERLLNYLQLFDGLSLWFCCGNYAQEKVARPPAGPAVTFRVGDGQQVVVKPWPWTAPSLVLDVSGRQVPARHYKDADQLAAAPTSNVTLCWELVPDDRRM